MSQAESSNTGARWWEGYAIRYGVGTVVGAVLFYILCTLNDALKPFLFGAQEKWSQAILPSLPPMASPTAT